MIIPIEKAGDIGVVTDRPYNTLPLNAWTSARNVRFRNGAVEKFFGHQAVMGQPVCPPHWLLHTAESGLALWLYAGATKVGATDGSTHVEVTRDGSSYTTSPVGWTGTIIEGIPVINNGVDVPQMWNTPALGTKLQNLTAWPGVLRANTLRALKRYLVALDCTVSGTRFPNLVKWSHQAPTGNVPDNWNELDHTKDAGEYSLPGEGGFLVDGVPLRDALILYKEHQAWRMDYVGGIDVFTFNRLFDNVGLLHRRCGVEFFSGKHLVFTGDDLVVHDGSSAESILAEKARGLMQLVDTAKASKSFLVTNYVASEVWVCFPEVGASLCTLALVWNWRTGTIGVRELPSVSFITHGIVNESGVGDTWDNATGSWDTDFQLWGDRVSDPSKRRLLMAAPVVESSPASWKFLLPEVTHQFSGVDMLAYVERLGIGFPVASGQPPDYHRQKQVLAVWPKVTGVAGGKINVSLGVQQKLEGPIQWSDPRTFVIGESDFLDFSGTESSRIHSIRFESETNISWKLDGYDVDVIDRGAH